MNAHRLDLALAANADERAALKYYRRHTFADVYRAGRHLDVELYDKQDPFDMPVYTLHVYLPDWTDTRILTDPHGVAIVQAVRSEHLDPNPEA